MSGLKIKSITADEGQYVKKGQTLATLDSSIIQAQLAAATARLEGSQASLEKAQQSKNSQDNADLQNAYKQALAAVADNQTLVDHAKADYKDAYAAAQKYKALLKQGTVSQEEVANQLNGARATAARLDTALAQLASSKSMAAQISERLHFSRTDTEKFDLAIARSAVAENKALVKQLQAQLAQTAITAPDDGLITRKDAHLGEISMPPKVLFEILGQGRLEARILVSQQDLNKIKIGDSVNITNDFGYTNGRVSYISQALEPSNRLAILRVEIPKSAPFKPGMSAKAGIKIAERTSIGIPPDAIISEGTKHYVYVAEKGQARKRPITIGEHHANQVEILKGLAPGSMVIKHADGSIRDGLKIRVADS